MAKYIALFDFHHEPGFTTRKCKSDNYDDALLEADEWLQKDGHLSQSLGLMDLRDGANLTQSITENFR
jgi:hypothetical protein